MAIREGCMISFGKKSTHREKKKLKESKKRQVDEEGDKLSSIPSLIRKKFLQFLSPAPNCECN